MSTRRTGSFRLALEIFLVLAFFLILTGGFFAQARSGLGSSNPAPSGSAAVEIQATPIASIQAALMAAEMAALTPPFFMVTLPIVQR